VAEQQSAANAMLASDSMLRAWHARLQVGNFQKENLFIYLFVLLIFTRAVD
jgi:hypothetical protein